MTATPPNPPFTCGHNSKFPARHNGEPACVECNAPVTLGSRLASSDDTLTATSLILANSPLSDAMLADTYTWGWRAAKLADPAGGGDEYAVQALRHVAVRVSSWLRGTDDDGYDPTAIYKEGGTK